MSSLIITYVNIEKFFFLFTSEKNKVAFIVITLLHSSIAKKIFLGGILWVIPLCTIIQYLQDRWNCYTVNWNLCSLGCCPVSLHPRLSWSGILFSHSSSQCCCWGGQSHNQFLVYSEDIHILSGQLLLYIEDLFPHLGAFTADAVMSWRKMSFT